VLALQRGCNECERAGDACVVELCLASGSGGGGGDGGHDERKWKKLSRIESNLQASILLTSSLLAASVMNNQRQAASTALKRLMTEYRQLTSGSPDEMFTAGQSPIRLVLALNSGFSPFHGLSVC
jgi:hypothetical protein